MKNLTIFAVLLVIISLIIYGFDKIANPESAEIPFPSRFRLINKILDLMNLVAITLLLISMALLTE